MTFTSAYRSPGVPRGLGSGGWRECFNSDSATYGGFNVGNVGTPLWADGGTLGLVIPANGFVVLERAG